MKCPGCSFAMEEQIDVCPRCLIDLRKLKRAIGLPVTSPNLKYEEILASMGIEFVEPVKKESKLKKIWEQIKAQKVKFEPFPEEQTTPIPQKEIEVPKPTPIVEQKTIVKKSEAIKPVAIEEKVPKRLPALKSRFLPKPNLEILPLFNQAFPTLPEKALVSEISTHVLTDLKSDRSKEILLLFEFCMESLSDPDFYKKYITAVPKKQIESIKSERLEERLVAAEAAVTAEELALRMPKIAVHKHFALVDAKAHERFFSFIIDSLLVVVLLLFVIVSWRNQYDASISLAILEFQPIDRSELKIIWGLIMALFPFILSIYLLISHLIFKRTIGEFFTEIRVVTESQQMPQFTHLLVRDGTTITTLLSWFLYPKVLRDTVSSLLSRTRVVRPVWD